MMLHRKFAVLFSAIIFTNTSFALGKHTTCPDIRLFKKAGIQFAGDSIIGYIAFTNMVVDDSGQQWALLTVPYFEKSEKDAFKAATRLLKSMKSPGVLVDVTNEDANYCAYSTGRDDVLAHAVSLSDPVTPADRASRNVNRP